MLDSYSTSKIDLLHYGENIVDSAMCVAVDVVQHPVLFYGRIKCTLHQLHQQIGSREAFPIPPLSFTLVDARFLQGDSIISCELEAIPTFG